MYFWIVLPKMMSSWQNLGELYPCKPHKIFTHPEVQIVQLSVLFSINHFVTYSVCKWYYTWFHLSPLWSRMSECRSLVSGFVMRRFFLVHLWWWITLQSFFNFPFPACIEKQGKKNDAFPKISGLRNSSRHMAPKINSDAQFPWLTLSIISAPHRRELVFRAHLSLLWNSHSQNGSYVYTLAQKHLTAFMSEMQSSSLTTWKTWINLHPHYVQFPQIMFRRWWVFSLTFIWKMGCKSWSAFSRIYHFGIETFIDLLASQHK